MFLLNLKTDLPGYQVLASSRLFTVKIRDLVACLGCDGVLLQASNLFTVPVPPVVSFNLGSLGFLTSHVFVEFKNDLRQVIHGNNSVDGVYITLRLRFHCEIFRNGKAMPGKVFDILNEVVVDRGSNTYLSKIECYEHDHLITKIQGDGAIVAAPNWKYRLFHSCWRFYGTSKCSVHALYTNLPTFSLIQTRHPSRFCSSRVEDSGMHEAMLVYHLMGREGNNYQGEIQLEYL